MRTRRESVGCEAPNVRDLFGIELRNRRDGPLPRESDQRGEAVGLGGSRTHGDQPEGAVLEDVHLVAAREDQEHVGEQTRAGSDDDEGPQEAVEGLSRIEDEDAARREKFREHIDHAVLDGSLLEVQRTRLTW
jgi:hypothetical protein